WQTPGIAGRMRQLHGALAMHLIRGRGVASVRASGSDELLSVRSVNTQHLMLHARKAHWQTPVTEAPLLFERSLVSSDPSFHRARRPLIMMMRSLASRASGRGLAGPQAVAGLSVAPAGISPFCR